MKTRFYHLAGTASGNPSSVDGEIIHTKLRYTHISNPPTHDRNHIYLSPDDKQTSVPRADPTSIRRLPVADECKSPLMSPEQKQRFNQTLDNATQAMGPSPSKIQFKLCSEAAVRELSPHFSGGVQFVPYLEAQLRVRTVSAGVRAESSEMPKEQAVEDAQALTVDPERSKGSAPKQPEIMTKAKPPAAGFKQYRFKGLVKPNPIKHAQATCKTVNNLSERESLLLEEAISEAITAIGPSAPSFRVESCARAAAMKLCSTLGNHNHFFFFEISRRVRSAVKISATKTRVKTKSNVPQVRGPEIAANPQALEPKTLVEAKSDVPQVQEPEIDANPQQLEPKTHVETKSNVPQVREPEIAADPQGLEPGQKSDTTHAELEATQSEQGNSDELSRQQKLHVEHVIKETIRTMVLTPGVMVVRHVAKKAYLKLGHPLRQHKWLLSLLIMRLRLARKGILVQTSDTAPTTQGGVDELSTVERYKMQQLIDRAVADIGRPRAEDSTEYVAAKVVTTFCKYANYNYKDWLPEEIHKRLTQAYSVRGLANKRLDDGAQLANKDTQGNLLVGKAAAAAGAVKEADAVTQAPEELTFEVSTNDDQEKPPVEGVDAVKEADATNEADAVTHAFEELTLEDPTKVVQQKPSVEEAVTSILIREEPTVDDESSGQEKALVEGMDAAKEADTVKEADAVTHAPEVLTLEDPTKDVQEKPPVEEADTSILIREEPTANDESSGQEKALVEGVDAVKEADTVKEADAVTPAPEVLTLEDPTKDVQEKPPVEEWDTSILIREESTVSDESSGQENTLVEGVDAVKEAEASIQIPNEPGNETLTPSVDKRFGGEMRLLDKTVGDAGAGAGAGAGACISNRSVDELSDEEARFLGKAIEGAIVARGPANTKKARRRHASSFALLIAPSLGNPEGLLDMIRREVWIGSFLAGFRHQRRQAVVVDTSSSHRRVSDENSKHPKN